jgi:hypothetical protein
MTTKEEEDGGGKEKKSQEGKRWMSKSWSKVGRDPC